MSDRVKAELDATSEKIAELSQDVGALKARDELRREKERPDQFQAAEQAGLPRDYFGLEEFTWKKYTPFKSRWPEVSKFDERVAAVEMRQAAVADELRELYERARRALHADMDALARGELAGRTRRRPERGSPRRRRPSTAGSRGQQPVAVSPRGPRT